MQPVPLKHNFSRGEEEILKLWDSINAFETSLKKSEGRPVYSFYDGPPFATGLPHYGHILAGTIKDTVTRYAHQTGHYVPRRFGWDCHGLPIEFEIDKRHGIKTKDQVLEFGIDNYNEACRSIVMTYSSEWKQIVNRLGRWIDFENDYKTMDISFMESVWWAFSQLYKKDLVYRGFKVMPYSTACTTPLSNFEANLDYKNVPDPAIMVAFPLVDDPTASLVAWTTTPWTLPSNLALAVHPEMEYVKIKEKASEKILILLSDRLPHMYKKEKDYEVLEKFPGKKLENKKYVPLFDYFVEEFGDRAFKVVCADYVTSDSGTGVVHTAPGFGEDDYQACLSRHIIDKEDCPCPVDANGRFVAPVKDFEGQYVKDADANIIKWIKAKGRLTSSSSIVHSYPFCWRSDTPLIYRAIPCWFVRVESIKEKLLKNNEETYWVPDWVKDKRFSNWLKDARDWAISRNRYWGTPLPIWHSEDFEEIKVIGSIAELEELSGRKITDLHRHFIDDIEIPSKDGKGKLKRVSEVFDCWFESGSMPYSQQHYPFENKDTFSNSFPANFIAEGIDQTRGWFYTLLVLSTALFDKPPFQNLIVNGLVLAADGRKMSKRLKNYPDPSLVISRYGADALRLYLINSPVVRGENLKFKEEGVEEVTKDVFIRWYNAFRLLSLHLPADFTYKSETIYASKNVMDKWILASVQSLIKFVREEMAAYRLYTVVPFLVRFIVSFANWFLRLNRDRIKGKAGEEEQRAVLSTLFYVLLCMCKVMAPFTPFFTEFLYQHLKTLLPEDEREDSIHYVLIPEPDEKLKDEGIERAVSRMQTVIELCRVARERRLMPVKYPLPEICIITPDKEYLEDVKRLEGYILKEVNAKKMTYKETDENISTSAVPDFKRLGKRLRGDMKKVTAKVQQLTPKEIQEFEETGDIEIAGYTLSKDDITIKREYRGGEEKNLEASWSSEVVALLDLTLTPELRAEGISREVINRIQKARKNSGLELEDKATAFFALSGKDEEKNKEIVEAVKKHWDTIYKTTGTELFSAKYKHSSHTILCYSKTKVHFGATFELWMTPTVFAIDHKAFEETCKDWVKDFEQVILSSNFERLSKSFEKDEKQKFRLAREGKEGDEEKEVELTEGKELFFKSSPKLL